MQRRILMFGWEFPPYNSGGLGVACQGIVRALAKQGTRVTFVLPRQLPTTSPYARIIFAGMGKDVQGRIINSALMPYASTHSYIQSLHKHAAPSIYAGNLLEEVMRYAILSREIAEEEVFDVIYAHDWLSFPAGMEAKRISGKPLIVHVHSTEFDRCGGPTGVNKDVYDIEKAGMEAADKVIVVSQFTKGIIVRHYGIPASKIEVVYNGIDDETMPKPGDAKSQLASLKEAGYAIVLFLGRITLQKGLDHLLRAAQKVLERNKHVVFLVSGSGDMERQMMELSAHLNISQNVLFAGFLRGAEQYEAYRLADLFVMPSVSEPFGITALEAMKLGTPVLVSKQSGVSEVIQHALKVDFWDTDELANKILSAVTHQALRQTLVEHGAREAERLTWERSVDQINRVIDMVAH